MYRVPTTGTIFKDKELDKENIWTVSVLVDASTSMTASWNIVESTYATLAEAWNEDISRLNLYSYSEHRGTCIITKLFYGGKLFATTPSGNTPSAQAILTVATIMPKGNRRFILHITDGKVNVGFDMRLALQFCEKENIDLVTIGTSGIDILELQDRFGSDYFEIIESLEDLPGVLASLLRSRLLGKAH